MLIKPVPRRWGWRRLLAVVACMTFVIFHFTHRDRQWDPYEQSPNPRTLTHASPTHRNVTETASKDLAQDENRTLSNTTTDSSPAVQSPPSVLKEPSTAALASIVPEIIPDQQLYVDPSQYRAIFSVSSTSGQFFEIDWQGVGTYNPSILPHPTQEDKYIVIAQLRQGREEFQRSSYIMQCTATFMGGVLNCSNPPTTLPIAQTPDTACHGNLQPGAHDARLFSGPNTAYLLYGSHSAHSCQGMWVQDLQRLLSNSENLTDAEHFPEPVDVQRPPPYRDIEKNYFLFWDHENYTFVHQDISPHRVFTSLYLNGSVGPNLAAAANDTDEPCLKNYMPKFGIRNATGEGIEYETIHQTTNSLSITLCKRSDRDCQPSVNNTFIMIIFQHKSFYAQHAEYFPYVMLFQQTAPFAVHALSTKSIWIYGRNRLTKDTQSYLWRGREDVPSDHTEMFFIVSMSWKQPGQMYHGYIDDEMLLSIGIEDTRPAGMDILAGDLLQDLAFCSSEHASNPTT